MIINITPGKCKQHLNLRKPLKGFSHNMIFILCVQNIVKDLLRFLKDLLRLKGHVKTSIFKLKVTFH